MSANFAQNLACSDNLCRGPCPEALQNVCTRDPSDAARARNNFGSAKFAFVYTGEQQFLAVESATPGGSEELCDNLQTAVKKLLSFNKNKIARLREQQSCLQRMIESGVQSNRANDAAAINRLVDRQGLVQDEIKKLTQTLNFLQTTVVSAKKECPVCMVAECDAMFSCGHTHCQVCSRILMSSTQPRCSICRCDLSSQKMFLIGQSDDFLVNKYGSKFPAFWNRQKNVLTTTKALSYSRSGRV